MASHYKRGKVYIVAYRLKGGPRQYVYGIKTRELAKQIKASKDRDEQLSRAGLLYADASAQRRADEARRLPKEHVEEWRQHIIACGDCEQHAQQQASHVRRLIEMARIHSIAEIRLERVQLALHKLLGPTRGPRTCNAARQAVIQWETWLRTTGRVQHTVLGDLTRFNEQTDVRRKRRPLSQEEVTWLLSTTNTAKDRVKPCGILPPARAMMYAVALGTGYRRKAILSLSKSSFFVHEDRATPFVRLGARFNKNGKDRDQAIPLELAAECREWLRDQPNEGPIWRPQPHANLSLRFHRDMDAARAAWIADAVDAEQRRRREASNTLKYVYHDGVRNVWADFHGLRHTGISFVVRRKGLRCGQEWADHSTPLLTANYAEVEHGELADATEVLPTIHGLRHSPRQASAGARSA